VGIAPADVLGFVVAQILGALIILFICQRSSKH